LWFAQNGELFFFFFFKVCEEEEWSFRKGVGVLYAKETSVVLGSGVKSNAIPPVTYLPRATNSKQLFEVFREAAE
jgi:hypothetical protein